MAGWSEILSGIQQSPFDQARRHHLQALADHTGRHVVAFYSAAFQKPNLPFTAGINDSDVGGLMNAFHELEDRQEKGLDLILHTPGGLIGATEAIVNYIRQMFGTNVRAIVPQIAMSAGTMIALSTREIVMGRQSSLGPIDPQIGGLPANLIIQEFDEAQEELRKNPADAHFWQIRLMKHPPTAYHQAKLAVERAATNVKSWLRSNMAAGLGDNEADNMIKGVVDALSDSNKTMAHDRHIHLEELRNLGLNVTAMEDDQRLQDLILSVHHAMCITLANTNSFRIIENQKGRANVLHHQ